MKFKAVKGFVNQETKQWINPGETVEFVSSFERGFHLAFKNVVPMPDEEREAAVVHPPEIRVFRRNKKRYTP